MALLTVGYQNNNNEVITLKKIIENNNLNNKELEAIVGGGNIIYKIGKFYGSYTRGLWDGIVE